MARPKRDINWDLIEKMIESGCPAKEIAGKCDLSMPYFYVVFEQHFEENYDSFRSKRDQAGCASLRLTQYAKAINGNIEMLKLLGRERLGQGLEKAPPPPNDEKVTEIIDNMKLQNKLVELEKIIEELRGQQPKTE